MSGGRAGSETQHHVGSITDADVAALFAPFEDLAGQGVVLAVSGGSDSMGLMHLFARWRALRAQQGRALPAPHIASIDHGLRPESAEEAAFVLAAARALGLPAHVRRWQGPKPSSGVSEAAREARYDLLAEVMEEVGARVLMTAHTADDQAETVLMRLARGSGVDGLAGMAPVRALARPAGSWLVRPLLGLDKERISSDLVHRGIAWRSDPTNADPDYERPRLRAARSTLQAVGLTPANLGRSAERLRRASLALEQIAQEVMSEPGVRIDPLGLVQLELAALRARPDEIALRVLRLAIEIAGGSAAPVSLASLEAVLDDLRAGRATAWTLARAALHAQKGALQVQREPGRSPLPRLPLRAGANLIWDGRFDITVEGNCSAMEVGPLGADGLAVLAAGGLARPKVPALTLRAAPAVWQGDTLIAVPLLGVPPPAAMQLVVRMRLRTPMDRRRGGTA